MKYKWNQEEIRQWYDANPLAAGRNTDSHREDTNLIVRNPRSMDWTLNWAKSLELRAVWRGGIVAPAFLIAALAGN